MNTNTAIAVGAAVVVVAVIFVVPGLSPFGRAGLQSATQAAPGADQSGTQATTQTNTQTQATMPQDIPQNVTQLMSKDDVVGTGATAAAGDTVTVKYVGMLTDGTVFDASSKHGDGTFTFALGAGQVIKGWDEGVAGMKEGGSRTLVIPASLGYGANGIPGVIPGNATLVFQVQLVKVAAGK